MLPLIFMLATIAPPTPAAPADGTYTYVSSLNGAPIGKTAITVRRDAAGIVLSEQGSGTFNGQQGVVKDTLTLETSQLSPTAYNVAANVDGRPVSMGLSFKGADAYQTGDLQKTYDLVENAKHFVVLDFGPFSGWFALPSQMQAWNGAPAVAIVPAMQYGITIAPDAALPADHPKTVPSADTALNVTSPMPFTLWYDPKTMVVDLLAFPTQGITVTRQP